MISETYRNIEIKYRENTNTWVFELGGREKSAGSLREAKDTIDKAPKPKREVVRFQAYLLSWSDSRIEEVTVGAASKDYRGKPQFWISNNGQRSKESATNLVKINDVNNVIVEEMRALSQQIVTLQAERTAKAEKLERVDIPDDDEPATT